MTASEKAKELVNKFRPFAVSENGRWDASTYNSKECAKITVEEIIDNIFPYNGENNAMVYWNEVLTEIDKL